MQQLETYLSLEPHAKLGIWANNSDISSETLFVYKNGKGIHFPKHKKISDLPIVGSPLTPASVNFTFNDLIIPSKESLYRSFSELLDKVVAQDGNVTRREEQLDQLCNLV